MQEALSTPSRPDVIASLEALLEEETQALIRLDSEGVQNIAQRKLQLCEDLASARDSFTKVDQGRLDRLKLQLRHNLILLAHAREHVHATVNLMTGRVSTVAPHQQQSAPPTRLDLRG